MFTARIFGLRRAGESACPTSEIVDAMPEVADLFARLGYDPALQERTAAKVAEMKGLVRAEITDFQAFRAAIEEAAAKTERESIRFEIRDRELLDAAIAAGDDEGAVLAILNRNPVYEQVPFVERVPVLRGGSMIWLTPVEHSSIRKRPADPVRFEQLADELENLYRKPHQARRDGLRLEVLGAIERLKRELKRDKAYIPTAIQSMELKLAAFEADSIQPDAKASVDTLMELLASLERVRVECVGGRTGKAQLRQAAAGEASRYLADSRLQIPRLTNHILVSLLTPELLEAVQWPGWKAARTARLIRNEIDSGFFDPAEIADRLRKVESQGLYIPSLVFPLLRLHQVRAASRIARVALR
jgi:hypothetical protein